MYKRDKKYGKKITVLEIGEEVEFRVNGGMYEKQGHLWIKSAKENINRICTVLKVEFDATIDVFMCKSGGIE